MYFDLTAGLYFLFMFSLPLGSNTVMRSTALTFFVRHLMKMWIVDLFFIASGGHRRLMQNNLLGEYVGVTAFAFLY